MRRLLLSVSLFVATPLYADVPRVVTDIAPVHSLAAMVMEGVGAPEILMKPGESPHHYSMRPSDAAALEKADLVIWISHELTPWLEDPIESLARDAEVLELMTHAPVVLEFGEDHDEHHDEAHDGHDEHADHADAKDDHHDEHHEEDHAEHDEEEAHAHSHDGIDPHAWLHTENARDWLAEIAEHLSEKDPDNAEAYAANAKKWSAKLDQLNIEISDKFASNDVKPFAVQHDAYAYFEAQFGLGNAFSIADGHAVDPGAARIAELRESVRENAISCVLTDGVESISLIETVIEGHQAQIVTADQLGAELTPGPLLYMDLMHSLADAIVDC